jgi:hypothetical protein
MKYSDLIQFEALETIVQLRDADKAASRGKFVSSYVISDDMADKICNVLIPQLQYKNPQDNKGVLVVGNYGTGKSHLMAVISSIAEDESLLNSISNEKVKKSAEQIAGQFKVIRAEIGGTTRNLRDIIISELEMYLEDNGISYKFLPADKLNNHKAAFEEMMVAFAEKFPNKGLLFVLDELLDFLRRRDNQQLVYDLSILREIGEICKDLKFRFISGVQEAIFDSSLFAFMGNDIRRVRERFETVSIIKEDIKYVVSQRLLKKNVHQETQIREHLSAFTKFYSTMNEKLDDFVQLFPIHPDYIDTFEELKAVEKREILKALSREMRKLLDKEVPHDEPGIIAFDSYWINLCDDPSFRTLPNVKAVMDCTQVLQSRVELSLPHKQFKPMALRIIHGLSLHRLTVGDIYSPVGATAEELRDRLCLYDKIISEMGSDEPEKELLTNIETVLNEIYCTVSGQFITRNRENNQYYLDLKKSDDYDAKIEERAKSLSPNQIDEYYYRALMEVLECPAETYRNGFKIWPHNIIWYPRNIYRRGYLFLGTPNERSTTVPSLDFYIYFLEPFEQTQYTDEKKNDEVFFSLTNKDERFESILRLYGGAVKQAETASGDAKGAYQSRANGYLKQLAAWLRDNNQTSLSVTYQGQTQTLSEFTNKKNLRHITGLKDNETINFRDLIDTVAEQCLEPYFNDLTPEYPKFSIKITRENLNQAVESALFAIADMKKTIQADAVLDALGLMDGGKITPYKSVYANFILGLKKNKGAGQVINRDEIITAKDGIEYLAESKYRLEPELVMVVVAALVAAGEIVLSVAGIKYDASKLSDLARAGIDNLIKFKHLEQSKEYNLPCMQALFSMFNLSSGKASLIATQGDQTSVADLQTEVQRTVKRIVETKNEIRDGDLTSSSIRFWDFNILEMIDLKNEINSLDNAKTFFESLERFDSPGKLKNLCLSVGDIRKHEGVLNTLDILDALLIFSNKNSSLVSWVKEALNVLTPSDAWAEKAEKTQKELKESFLALYPVTAHGIKTIASDFVQKIESLKAEYIVKYSSWHSAVRLNTNEEKKKTQALRDVRLIALENLSQINILPKRQIEEYKKSMESLVSCSQLSSTDLKKSPVCPYCHYNPLADGTNGGASKKLEEAENTLENMVADWTETLLKNLNIPWVKENMNLLRPEYKTIMENFVAKGKLPSPINDDFIIALKEALTSLIKVSIKIEDIYKILQQTGGSVTHGELRDIFNAYIDKLIEGKEANKVRIIVD